MNTDKTGMEQDDRGLFEALLSEDGSSMPMSRLTELVIGWAFTVSNTLGCGFLEKVYENALAIEIKKAGLRGCSSNR